MPPAVEPVGPLTFGLQLPTEAGRRDIEGNGFHPKSQPALSLPQRRRSHPMAQSCASENCISQQACSCGLRRGSMHMRRKSVPADRLCARRLWFDFGTEARYDALVQQIGDPRPRQQSRRTIRFSPPKPSFHRGHHFHPHAGSNPALCDPAGRTFCRRRFTTQCWKPSRLRSTTLQTESSVYQFLGSLSDRPAF